MTGTRAAVRDLASLPAGHAAADAVVGLVDARGGVLGGSPAFRRLARSRTGAGDVWGLAASPAIKRPGRSAVRVVGDVGDWRPFLGEFRDGAYLEHFTDPDVAAALGLPKDDPRRAGLVRTGAVVDEDRAALACHLQTLGSGRASATCVRLQRGDQPPAQVVELAWPLEPEGGSRLVVGLVELISRASEPAAPDAGALALAALEHVADGVAIVDCADAEWPRLAWASQGWTAVADRGRGRRAGEPAGAGRADRAASLDELLPDGAGPARVLAVRPAAERVAVLTTRPRGRRPLAGQLSARQQEILGLVAAGTSDAAIATRLGAVPATVRNHVAAATARFGARGRAEAIAAARELGLI